ncbi:metal tolerance protein 4-like [Hevea brasiliensis]|uniref:metal tolerance protein 4-like n=1 Tax=Hevea brasiliensis TaxID=3981 RepID=UPI0025E41DC7|nr:metal tolerance protein 4-like [Hevea brasiliensis]
MMESESNSNPKAPLLIGNERKRSGRLSRTLRDDFFSTLLDKVRSGVDIESPFYIDVSKTKGLTKDEKKYYERQFATLESFEEVDSLESDDTVHEEDDDEQLQAERAMRISNYANIPLLAFKVQSQRSFFKRIIFCETELSY